MEPAKQFAHTELDGVKSNLRILFGLTWW